MLSYMYYVVRDLIKKEYKDEFSLTKDEKKYLFICSIGVLMIMTFLISWVISKKSSFMLAMVIGGGVGIYGVTKANKLEQTHNVQEHVETISESIKKVGLNSPEKIEKLRYEIKEFNDNEEEKVKKLLELISKTFKNVVWIPLSFLLGLFFNKNFSINISFDDIVTLLVVVVTYALMFIGVAISFFSYIPYVFQYGRIERERVLQYLLDIEYFRSESRGGDNYHYR